MESEDKIVEALKTVGISQSEVSIYLDLVRSPGSSVQEISKRVNIYRSNAYEALRRLMKRGLIEETRKDGSMIFNAKSADAILEYVGVQRDEVEKVIPRIKEIEKMDLEEESVSISHGMNSFREAYNDFLNMKMDMFTYNVPINVTDIMGEGFLDEYHNKRIKNGTEIQIIFKDEISRIGALNKRPKTEARYLFGEGESAVNTSICGNFVHIMIFEKPYTFIKIRSKRVAQAYYNIFKANWERAKIPVATGEKTEEQS
ncbi:hypothetical protein CMI47_00205 [Candidatus Pacearchaeota archaeon]|nr:hypothetical protein [Candidatus Pacearchaeota archaeon]|tara:strand:+ start:17182 stop:17955 length:774 start_codon:yes stop_codon:yes gene_type:complete